MTKRPPTTEIRIVLRTILSAGLLAAVLVLACVGAAAGATWVVDDGGGAGVDYTTIQAAVDAASAGDTIEVASGTYVENVDNVKFRGVVTGEPDFGGAVGSGGVNVQIDEILSDPTGNLEMWDVVTITWPIVPPFVYIDAAIGGRVEVCGAYRDIGEIPIWWSEVGEHWVCLCASDHLCRRLNQPDPPDKSLFELDFSFTYWFQNDRVYEVTDHNVISDMAGVPGWDSAIPTSEFNPAGYPRGPRFITTGAESDGLLIRQVGDYKAYRIENGKKRHITYPDVMDLKGYSFDDIIEVSSEISDMFSLGDPIGIEIDLYFNKKTDSGDISHESQFVTGETVRSITDTTVVEDYTVETYVKMIKPDGTGKFAYHENSNFQPTDPLQFSDVKRSLYPGTWSAQTKTWNWDEYTFDGTEMEGVYIWEFWYEDVASGKVLGKDVQGYEFTTVTPPFTQPVIISPLEITPIKDIYYVGDNLNAEFTITNRGGEPVTFDALTVGGRLNGWCPTEGCPDFTHRTLTLHPGESYHYEGSLTSTQSGNYHFFIAYYIENPTPEEKKLLDENNWNTCIDIREGLTHTDRIKNIIVLEEEISDPDTISELRDKITRELQRQVYCPPYLPDPNSFTSAVATVWASFTSWITQTHLTERYDELYHTGIDYESLRFKALINARDSLDRGDSVSAKKYLQKSYTYGTLSAMSFGAAAEVFEDNLDAGEILAEGIKDGCEASVSLGLGVTNPVAAKAADYVYIGVDYAVDRALVGEEQAAKNAVVSAAVTTIFNEITFGDLGDRTIADYTENRIGKVTFPILQKAFQNNENLQFALSKIIKECGVGLGDEAVEDLVYSILDELENAVDLEQIEVKSPVELWVCDSRGSVTGLLHGAVEHGISRSMYCDETVTILYPLDSYRYEVVGTEEGTYGLNITSIEDGNATTFTATNIPTSPNAMHRYTIDWAALSQGEEGVTIQIDSDGDGVFERTITADDELTADEFGESPPSAASSTATGATKNAYRTNEDVYAAGSGFTTANADIYLVQDQDWNDGDPIPADVTGSVETVSVNGGAIAPVLIWHAPLAPGRYDIVIDANRNGVYDAHADGLDGGSPGFTVITSPPPTPPTDVPALMSHGIIALIGLFCVIGVSKIRRRFN